MWAAERPAPRTGATRRGPRPRGSIVWGGDTNRPTRQAPARGHLRANGSPRAGWRTQAGHAKGSGWFVNRSHNVTPGGPGCPVSDPEYARNDLNDQNDRDRQARWRAADGFRGGVRLARGAAAGAGAPGPGARPWRAAAPGRFRRCAGYGHVAQA